MEPVGTAGKAVLVTGLWVLLSGALCPGRAEPPSVIEVGAFSEESPGGLPSRWEPLEFKKIERRTRYVLVEEDGEVVLQATADDSASGLVREISIDPQAYPVVRWRWKVSGVLEKGNVHRKEGDDYPARVYILFRYEPEKLGFFDQLKYEAAKLFYGEYPPLHSINYIWSSRAEQDLMIPNPHTERAMMVVVQSGDKGVNTWIDEERNVYEDYKRAFGSEPPRISGVAVMTDTDNTGESATAWYGNIQFRRASP